MSNTRLCIVGRWSATPQSDWYPWLRQEIREKHPQTISEVLVPAMPNPGTPTIEAWRAAIGEALGSDAAQLSRTLLVGHSVGCQAALHFLESLPEGALVGGLLCVAGWWTVDRPWETILPWINATHDDEKIKRTTRGKIRLLLSDNDPFTSNFEENGDAWRARLGAQVELIPGGKHFNAAEEPAVLRAILAAVAHTPPSQ